MLPVALFENCAFHVIFCFIEMATLEALPVQQEGCQFLQGKMRRPNIRIFS
jgi:hypothetical protein